MKSLIFATAVFLASASAFASVHSVFVCNSSDKSVGHGVSMFAYDQSGGVHGGTQSGYCPLTTDADGKAYGSYFCWVGNTQTATTTDGQLAIQFSQSMGSGAWLVTQMNLSKDLLSAGYGTGVIRNVSRGSQDLSRPLRQEGASSIECKLQEVDFN